MHAKFSRWLVILLFVCAGDAFAGLRVDRLRCEYLENPLGIDAAQPRLSWILDSNERGQRQTAYQILAASSADELKKDRGDLWDSGKVSSDQTTFVTYGGKPLASRQACFWKVRSWDQDGQPSPWSKVAFWEMGLLKTDDWQAQWIARTTNMDELPAPLFRRELTLDGKIKRARVYICGLGYYELHINGQIVGDQLLDPGYTRYDRRDLYVTHDVTSLLKRGPNAIGVILGNGWFNVQTRPSGIFTKRRGGKRRSCSFRSSLNIPMAARPSSAATARGKLPMARSCSTAFTAAKITTRAVKFPAGTSPVLTTPTGNPRRWWMRRRAGSWRK
jgi:hypothetical protein